VRKCWTGASRSDTIIRLIRNPSRLRTKSVDLRALEFFCATRASNGLAKPTGDTTHYVPQQKFEPGHLCLVLQKGPMDKRRATIRMSCPVEFREALGELRVYGGETIGESRGIARAMDCRG
jgi:hypothetical protein